MAIPSPDHCSIHGLQEGFSVFFLLSPDVGRGGGFSPVNTHWGRGERDGHLVGGHRMDSVRQCKLCNAWSVELFMSGINLDFCPDKRKQFICGR